jgi:aarF domain-containing kinase
LERGFATEFSIGENGPTSEEYDTFIKFLDAKRRLTNMYSTLYNVSVGWWLPGAKWRDYEGKSSLPINHAKLVDELLYIHGHQILVDGCFNGDPHPGNSEWRILVFFLTR